MPDAQDRLMLATPKDLADALAFAPRFDGRKRAQTADELMTAFAAKGIVERREDSGFVIVKRRPEVGGAALGRGAEKR